MGADCSRCRAIRFCSRRRLAIRFNPPGSREAFFALESRASGARGAGGALASARGASRASGRGTRVGRAR